MQQSIGYILLAFALIISVSVGICGSALDLPVEDILEKIEVFLAMLIVAIFGGILVIAGELKEIKKELKK